MIVSKKRTVRPYYIMSEGKEFDITAIVKAIKKKITDKTITTKEINLIKDIGKAHDNYKKSSK
jgi:hypothetical protein